MKRSPLTIFLLFCVIISGSAQDNSSGIDKIHGVVLSENQTPVSGAVVTCINRSDSSVICWTVTDSTGAFVIEDTGGDFSNSILEISFLGYEKLQLMPQEGQIVATLQESSLELDAATVTASSATLRRKSGKFIYSPNIVETEGLDSYEMLRYTPLLRVEDNVVSILGKGASQIYINGRKPVMDDASLMEMLRSIPAGQIENIEIITTPGSAYKASTTGGIVNISMKKNQTQGLTGSASVTGSYNTERFTPRASLYLGYSKKKFNASASFSYSRYNTLNETDTYYSYGDTRTDILNSARTTDIATSINGNFNATYDFTPESTLGASLHIGGGEGKFESDIKTVTSSEQTGEKHSFSKERTRQPFERPKIGAAVYYNLKTDGNGSNLDLSANYSGSLDSSLGEMEYPYSIFKQNRSVESHGWEFMGKYEHDFEDESILEAGYEFNYTNIDYDFIRKDFNGVQYADNPDYSNNFIYDESINALYVTYDRMWTDALNTIIGVRAEHTHIKGNLRNTGEKFEHNYIDFFPQVSISLDLADGDHNLSLDFSQSIRRPFYNYLNPFKIWTSENTYTMGNPDVKPLKYTDIDFYYTMFGDYVFGAYYSHEADSYSEYAMDSGENTTVSSITNFGSCHNLSFYFNLNKSLFNGVWRLSANAEANYEIQNGSIEGRDAGYEYWYASAGIYNIFRISSARKITGRLSYAYYTPSRGIFWKSRNKHLLGISISKEFKFGGTLNLDCSNLLNYAPTRRYRSADYSSANYIHTNNITVQLKYTQSFGHSRVKGARDRSSSKMFSRFKN